ncbi:YbaB/EbfC family nucleoid-associated protein [Candidatus Saccharibacteria bacterium]|nr:YbaB/EbfC family nucleoid-associated protein [Candidatus Saccharibacteria bacterium]
MAFDQLKMLNEARKAQKELSKKIIEVDSGDGAVIVRINGEMKIQSVKLDPELIDFDDIEELERWIENAMRDGYAKAQEVAQETMQPLMGKLGLMGQ